MAAEVNAAGNWFAFPTVQPNVKGVLERMELRQAQAKAIAEGNVKHFGTDKEAALRYANGGYKADTPLDTSELKKQRITQLMAGQ
jgi:hypothetical protein